MKTNSIAILLATYNGEKYLKEQIDSLLAQTYKDWCLYIHDDGSTDGTLAVVNDYIHRYHEKMTLLSYPSQGSACHNFLSLLERVEAPYYMFCDQDDVWLPDKIERSMQAMKQEEGKQAERGIVVFTDLNIVDERLQTTHGSLWQFSGIYPEYIRTFSDAGGHTVLATGCTMLFNRRAKKYCFLHPYGKAMMHDSWLCLSVLKEGGAVHGLNMPLVLYRQHENNCLGSGNTAAKAVDLAYRIRNIRQVLRSNWRYYSMLRALGYGSVLKYLHYKIKYKVRIKRSHY